MLIGTRVICFFALSAHALRMVSQVKEDDPSVLLLDSTMNAELRMDLDDLGLESVRLGQIKSASPRRILWHHITKCAGSFVCSIFRSRDVVQPDRNCAWKDGDSDQFRAIAPQVYNNGEKQCEKRYSYYQAHDFKSGLIEREINDADVCPNAFAHGVFVRDPLSRMTSWINFVRHMPFHKPLAELKEAIESGQLWPVGSRHKNGHFRWGWEHFDNYIVRMLAGTDVYNAPPGQITKAHFELAKSRLDQMDFVAVVEKDGISERDIQRLSDFFERPITAKKKINASRKKNKFLQNETEFLEDLNHWSIKLMEYARTISQDK